MFFLEFTLSNVGDCTTSESFFVILILDIDLYIVVIVFLKLFSVGEYE